MPAPADARSARAVERTSELVAELLGERSVTVLDVGARWGSTGGWWTVPPLARIVGFEPDADECARLNAALLPNAAVRYVPTALGRATGTATLFVTEEPACSSLYPPDESLAARYPDLAGMRGVGEVSLPVVSLDEWVESEGERDVVFAKLDTQGSELDILEGAPGVLAGILGLEVEVQFAPLYRDSPVFADVDRNLRDHGLALWRLEGACHYAEELVGPSDRTDRVHFGGMDVDRAVGSGRLWWANAIYFRDPPGVPADDGGRRLLVLGALLAACGDRSAAALALRRGASGHAEQARIERHAAALTAMPRRIPSRRARLLAKLPLRRRAS